MTKSETAAVYIGVAATLVAVAIGWLLHWVLGLVLTVGVLGVAIWYLRQKKTGDTYLRQLAEKLGCRFESGGAGYGRVVGRYKGRDIEISVNRSYDAVRGIGGFALSEMLMGSAMGVVAGINNLTAVKLAHHAHIQEPRQLSADTFLDVKFLLYLPPSNSATGLPTIGVGDLVNAIDELGRQAELVESGV